MIILSFPHILLDPPHFSFLQMNDNIIKHDSIKTNNPEWDKTKQPEEKYSFPPKKKNTWQKKHIKKKRCILMHTGMLQTQKQKSYHMFKGPAT